MIMILEQKQLESNKKKKRESFSEDDFVIHSLPTYAVSELE